MHSPKASLLLPILCTLALLAGCEDTPDPAPVAPDLILSGALSPGGEIMRISLIGGRITEIVANTEPINATVRQADLITLGVVDAHAHPEGLGNLLVDLDLSGTDSYQAVLQRIADRHAALPPGAWITGRGWDQEDWADAPAGGWPLAADLDRLVGDRPVAVRRIDGHALWLSSAAMPTLPAEDPAGGRILRDEAGAAIGVLIDNAMELVHPPEPSAEERVRRLQAADHSMAQVGLVGVHAMGVDDAWLAAFEQADAQGLLKVRVWIYLSPDSAAAKRLFEQGPWAGERVAVVGVKAFADGALGSRGALLSDDYSDEPGKRGLPLSDVDTLASLAERALRARAQLVVHAIGDAGVSMVLDAYERAREAVPEASQIPLRVEHAQVVRPEDRARFAMLNVVASMQPTHATSDMPWAEARLGPDRVGWSYSWKSLHDAGALIAFGSDFPVENVSPSYGLWAATTRRSPDGQPPGGWRVEESVSLEQALQFFTVNPYRALGQTAPTLEPGQAVDLTLWSVEQREGAPWLQAVGVVLDGEWVGVSP